MLSFLAIFVGLLDGEKSEQLFFTILFSGVPPVPIK